MLKRVKKTEINPPYNSKVQIQWSLMEDNLYWKTTFDGRQPLIGNTFWWKTPFYKRWPLMEEDLWWKTAFDGGQLFFFDKRWLSIENKLPLKTNFDERRSSILTIVNIRRPLVEENKAYDLEGFINWSLAVITESCLVCVAATIVLVELEFGQYHFLLIGRKIPWFLLIF